ncbi:MAG: SnoaL-like protein, partial [Myxococcaceae bacterium]|nr:SnoaL-like protein [Myxococcaceae bacterium]
RFEGMAAIETSARAMATVFLKYELHVEKKFVCATGSVIVNTWTGGFEGRDKQFGVEIWTLRDDLVVHQEQYMFLEVQSSRSLRAQLRLLLAGEPRVMVSLARAAAQVGAR